MEYIWPSSHNSHEIIILFLISHHFFGFLQWLVEHYYYRFFILPKMIFSSMVRFSIEHNVFTCSCTNILDLKDRIFSSLVLSPLNFFPSKICDYIIIFFFVCVCVFTLQRTRFLLKSIVRDLRSQIMLPLTWMRSTF